MRCTSKFGYFLSGSAVVALLAGCSGGGSSLTGTPSASGAAPASAVRSTNATARNGPDIAQLTSLARPGTLHIGVPNRSPSFVAPNATGLAAVAVSDAGEDTVDVYNSALTLIATLTGFSEPQGLASDTAGDIFIADTVNSRIVVYENDYATVKETLNDPGQYPAGVAVQETSGLVGVTNIISTSGGPGSVSIYAKFSPNPCVTVSNPNFARVYFDAFDAVGNLYVDGQDANGNTVVGVVRNGCKSNIITQLLVGNTIQFPGGVQVTPNGLDRVVIGDQLTSQLYNYKAPLNNSLKMPVETTTLSGASDAVTFAFTANGARIWTADAGLAESIPYTYPGGVPGKPITGLGEPIGVAVVPVAVP
jgi:hypothetical protein